MRVHLGIALVILVCGIIAGIWYAGRSDASSKDPVDLRNAIAQSEAVVATIVPIGAGGPQVAQQVTFIQGKGWVWQSDGGSHGVQPAMLISTSSEMLQALAPGCYASIPANSEPSLPPIPGLTIALDLRHVPQATHHGDVYTYQVGGGQLDVPVMNVTEDLSSIAKSHQYSAHVATSEPSTAGGETEGVTVRRATQAERTAAIRLLTTAHASPATTITFAFRVAGYDVEGDNTTAMTLSSLKDCPTILANAGPSALGDSPPSLEQYAEFGPPQLFGQPLSTNAKGLMVDGVLPVPNAIDSAADQLLTVVATATPESVILMPGATFALPKPGEDGVVFVSVTSCKPAPWLQCGG